MSKDLIVQLFNRIDNRDWSGLKALVCQDVVYERPGYTPIVGAESLLDFYENVRIIASGRHELTRIVADTNTGACWGSFSGQHRNGSPLSVRFADCYTFEDGMIKTRTSYFFVPAV